MKSYIRKFGQLCIIIFLFSILAYSKYSNKEKINVDVLNSSIYVDEKINETLQSLKELNQIRYDTVISCGIFDGQKKQDIESMHKLTQLICSQIKDLKNLAVDISGGMKEKGNMYTLNNLAYNFGHSNILTGDKGENNGEGSKLKLNIEKLRELEIKLLSNSKDNQFIERFLSTADSQSNVSDYIFSWEEQYFKLLPTV